jgi:hypothetical protein
MQSKSWQQGVCRWSCINSWQSLSPLCILATARARCADAQEVFLSRCFYSSGPYDQASHIGKACVRQRQQAPANQTPLQYIDVGLKRLARLWYYLICVPYCYECLVIFTNFAHHQYVSP